MMQKKIIVKVSDDLHRSAKIEAAKRGVTLSEVVRDALAAFVSKPARKPKRDKGGDKTVDDGRKE